MFFIRSRITGECVSSFLDLPIHTYPCTSTYPLDSIHGNTESTHPIHSRQYLVQPSGAPAGRYGVIAPTIGKHGDDGNAQFHGPP